MTSNRGRQTERVGKCDRCNFKMHLSLHRKEWLCRGCLMSGEIPPRLEDHMHGSCALADLSLMEGEVPGGVGQGTRFSQQLDAAMRKCGLMNTREEVKQMMAIPWFQGR